MNGIAFRDATGRIAAILSLDVLFVGPQLERAVTEFASSRLDLAPTDTVLLATHTHFAPAVDPTKPRIGTVDGAYLAKTIDACCDVIERLVGAHGTAATIIRGTGTSHAGINRRRPWPLPNVGRKRLAWGEAAMAPNPGGPIDPTVTLLQCLDEAGVCRAILWHYACHPSGFTPASMVGPDFVGVVRARLRAALGGDVPVLFLQGFAGDIRPRVEDRRRPWRRFIETTVYGPSFDVFTLEGWRGWAAALADDVLAASLPSRIPANPLRGRVRSAAHDMPLDRVLRLADPDRTIAFRRLVVSDAFDLVAVSAEPLAGLRPLVPWPGCTTCRLPR